MPITAHAHAAASIAEVVAAGFDSVEHCTFIGEDTDTVVRDDRLIEQIAANVVAVSLTVGIAPGGPPLPDRVHHMFDLLAVVWPALRAAAARMVCGSDNGIGEHKPHDSYGHSVAAMVTLAGLSPAEALRSATSAAATVCRVDDRKGTIAAGKDADLITIAGNPLTNIGSGGRR